MRYIVKRIQEIGILFRFPSYLKIQINEKSINIESKTNGIDK